MKTVLRFILLWLLGLVLIMFFIIPNTSWYHEANQAFDQVIAEKQIDIPSPSQHPFYRNGFVVGFIVGKYPLSVLGALVLHTLFVVLVLVLLHWLTKNKSKNILLQDPLDSVKNVLSNLLLFTFGIFNRRAANQLRFFFDLPIASRIIGLLAYSFIFAALALSYRIPDLPYAARFRWLIYVQVLIPVVLVFLTFFLVPFRKNFQRRLFWLSLSGAVIVLAASSLIGFQMAQAQLTENQLIKFDFAFFDTNVLLVNLLVVLAFSFYIEIIKQVSTNKSRIEAEMSLAHSIQNELLPVLQIKNSHFHLYGKTEAANEVGGDYCDAVQLQDGRFAVAVGDVSGHNVAAGVLMGMLKVAFRTELNYLNDPRQLVVSLNRTIYEHKNKSMFISFLFALIDPAKKSMILINCGHPPLLHFSTAENTINEYRTGDIALGLQQNSQFQARTISFSSGDIFLFMSDGLCETLNMRGEELGVKTVRDLVVQHHTASPQELYQILVAASTKFRGPIPQRDDLTMIIVKMN
ncbi:serine/threonine-protein phosphatase [candidate division KSB1 bacterium]|nr:serine/threonine-protein phosphatase [candidate division KSB1 bacterium]